MTSEQQPLHQAQLRLAFHRDNGAVSRQAKRTAVQWTEVRNCVVTIPLIVFNYACSTLAQSPLSGAGKRGCRWLLVVISLEHMRTRCQLGTTNPLCICNAGVVETNVFFWMETMKKEQIRCTCTCAVTNAKRTIKNCIHFDPDEAAQVKAKSIKKNFRQSTFSIL